MEGRKEGRTDGSVTISLRNFVGEGIIIIRNGANTISLPNFVWGT
jgi:hypothetical protein